ncbi:hypothetical protein [Streptomyces sp. NPDC086838]|uniref:hypothetical protein n=1 Tax=Streptomyces sp. NPDC086838 TaxID=3365762 RepID=UPI003830EB18
MWRLDVALREKTQWKMLYESAAGSSIAATGKTGGFAPRRAGPVGAGSPVSIHPQVVSEIR